MKKIIFAFLLSLNLGLNSLPEVFQVISPHPHDVELVKQNSLTYFEHGRLWLVVPDPQAPPAVMKHLRPVKGQDVRTYYPRVTFTKSLPDLRIKAYTSLIDSNHIRSKVLELTQFKTRAVGTPENREATAQIEKFLGEQGLETTQICYRPDHCSVIAERKGMENPDEVILVMAHLDSVGKDFAGADDNGSGSAVLMEMARVLSKYPNKKTLRFFVTNGEERGLLGAIHYVKTLKKNDEIKQIILAINMDMVGYNANGLLELETDASQEALAQWMAALAAKYTGLKTKITLGAWGSDHVPFLEAQVPAILTIEDWSTKTPCYHLACDKPDTLNYPYAAEVGKLNLAAVLTKDLKP